MHAAPLVALVRRVAPDADAVPDPDLLDRFARAGDQAAFELLVWRHGAMVWAACRRLAPDHGAAEDAAQVTFAALAAHAGRLRDRTAVAAWLHRVAVRAALELRTTPRPSSVYPEFADPPARGPDPARAAADREVRALLDVGLNRLPDKLRVPFVLCELEGRSNAEAAVALGCPVGTVESRLTRARQRLRTWLAARGVLPAVVATGAVAVPEAVHAAMLRAADPTRLSAVVRSATARAVPSLVSAKVRAALAVGIVLTACAVGLGLTASADTNPVTPPAKVGTIGGNAAPVPGANEPGGAALPAGAVARFGSPRLRHGSWVFDVCFSPDGKRLASVGMDAALRVWDGTTGEQLFVVRRDKGDFGRVCFAPGGRVAAVGHGPDLAADVWWIDGATGKVLDRKALPGVKIRKADRAVRFSRDGTRLAIGDGFAKRLVVLDTATADEVWAAKLGDEVPGGVGFAPDGKTVAVATGAGKVRLFDNTGRPAEVLSAEVQGLTNVALAPAGSTVVVAAGDDAVAWTRATGKVLWKGRAPAGYSLTFSPDGKRIVHSAYGYRAATVDPADGHGGGINGKPGAAFDWMVEATCSAFRPDGSAVAFGTISGTVCLFDPVSGRPVAPSADPPHEVRWMRFAPDGKTLYGWSGDWFAWDVATGKQRRVTHTGWNYAEPLSPDGRLTARTVWYSGARPAGSDDDGTRFEICDAGTGKAVHSYRGKQFSGLGLGFNAFTPDGRAVVGALPDGTVRAWAIDTGRELFNLPGHKAVSQHHAFSADGRVLVTGAYDAAGTAPVRVYDVGVGKELGKFDPGERVVAVAASADGRRVAAATSANARGREDPREVTVVWDVATGKVLTRVPQKREVRHVALSPDGRLVALAPDWDGEVRVHEVASGGVRFTFRHGGQPTGLLFAPDGRTLVVASKEAPVILWDVAGALTTKPPAWDAGTADRVWADLASKDAAVAFAAVRLLRANPEKAVPLLAERTKLPAVPTNLKDLLADLGADDFATRERATAALADLGEAARPSLAEAARATDPEAKKRAGELLARLDAGTPGRVRLVRAVESVEGIDARGAWDLLDRWAGGSGGATLAAEANAALLRRTR